MGLRAVTDEKPVTIYRKDRDTQNGGKFTTYSIGIASKDKDGNWVNGFIDCVFRKGTEVNNKAKIKIADSFYTVNEYNGKKYIKLFILDFTVVDQGEVPQPAPAPNDNEWLNIPDNLDDSSLPFN